MARHGQGAIVLDGIHDLHSRPELLPESHDPIQGGYIGSGGARHDGQAALETIGVGELHALLLGAGQGMTADEVHFFGKTGEPSPVRGRSTGTIRPLTGLGSPVRFLHAGNDRSLRAAGIGEQRARPAVLSHRENVLGNVIDWSTHNDEIGRPGSSGQVQATFVDRSHLAGLVQATLIAADTEHDLRQATFLRSQADGAADQADADDGKRVHGH